MLHYDGAVNTEQQSHLRLREPHGFLLHTHLQSDAAVWLVKDDLASVRGGLSVCRCYFILFHKRFLFILRFIDFHLQRYNKK